MNSIEVAKHLPLIKLEILEDVESKGHLILYIAKSIDEAKKREFSPKFVASFDSLEKALQGALYIYLSGDFTISGKEKNLRCKVKNQITLTEFVRGRDGGSEWADPENDIVKSGTVSVDINCGTDDHQHYETGYAPYNPMYGISEAYTSFIELNESYLPSKKAIKDIVAFTWRDKVFNEVYVMQDQLAISGTSVDGSYEGEEGDHRVKVGYFKDYVNFHNKNEIYIVEKSAYLDGKKIFEVDPGTQRLADGFCNSSDEIVKWVKEKYPSAKWLNGEHFGMTLSE